MRLDNLAEPQPLGTNPQDVTAGPSVGPSVGANLTQLKTPVTKLPAPKLRRLLKPFFDAAKDAAERGIRSSVCSTESAITVTFEKGALEETLQIEPQPMPLVAGQRAPKPWR